MIADPRWATDSYIRREGVCHRLPEYLGFDDARRGINFGEHCATAVAVSRYLRSSNRGTRRRRTNSDPGTFHNVSRRHAAIWFEKNEYRLCDLESRGGTGINGVWLAP